MHRLYESMFIVRHCVILGRFLLENWGCVGPRECCVAVSRGPGMRMRGAAGRGSPGLVSSSLSMAIYMVDGSHL